MNHTPGPWTVDGNNIRCTAQPEDTGTYIAEMVSSVSCDTTTANAQLIAAAPTMLEALEQLYNWMRDHTGPSYGTIDILTTAHAVLLNALGKVQDQS